MPQRPERKPRPVDFGAGVLAQAETDSAHRSHLGREVIGGAFTMLAALAYAIYEYLLAPFVSR